MVRLLGCEKKSKHFKWGRVIKSKLGLKISERRYCNWWYQDISKIADYEYESPMTNSKWQTEMAGKIKLSVKFIQSSDEGESRSSPGSYSYLEFCVI